MKLKYYRICEKCDDILEVKSEAEALVDVCDDCKLDKKPCSHCKELFEPKNKIALYCSGLCRSRAAMDRHGRSAKPVKCRHCGEMFKRRSAKNTLCLDCREIFMPKKKIVNARDEFPVLDRITEIAMTNEWLKNNKVKVG